MGGCLSQQRAAPVPLESEQTDVPERPSQLPVTPRSSKLMDRIISGDIHGPRASNPPRYVNAAYWPQWLASHGRLPSTFDISKLSHIFYAFASINNDGTVWWTDVQVDLQTPVDGTTGFIHAWTQLKSRYSNLRVVLSIGGEGASCRKYAWIGAHPDRRERFATSAKHLLQTYNLDGIDINWGPASAEEGQNLLELVKAVRKVFSSQFAPRIISSPPKYIITASLPASQGFLRHVPLAAVSKELDLVNLMAYDFVNSQSEETGHHAQLFTGRTGPQSDNEEPSCEISVEYLKARGVPPNKILLGIPLFGRSFLGADGPHQAFVEAGGINGIHEVRNLPRPGTEEIYEDHLGAAWCGSSREFVTYDNDEAIFEKAWFVKDYGLAGLFYWHMGYDRVGEKSLVRKGWDTLNELRAGHS